VSAQMTTTTSTNTGDFAKYPGMFTPAQVWPRPHLPPFCPCRVQTLSRTLKSTQPCVYFHHPLDRTRTVQVHLAPVAVAEDPYPYPYETGQYFI
jgi:hypothetical protein